MSSRDRRRPELEQTADTLMETVGLLYREVQRQLRRDLPFRGLTAAQVELVVFVHDRPRARVGEAATALTLAPNTVSTLVAQMVAAGYLRRVSEPTDRRVARLMLTRRATEEVRRWRSHRRGAVSIRLGELAAADVRALAAAVPALEALGEQLRSASAVPDAS